MMGSCRGNRSEEETVATVTQMLDLSHHIVRPFTSFFLFRDAKVKVDFLSVILTGPNVDLDPV